jgi:hypothetical protein
MVTIEGYSERKDKRFGFFYNDSNRKVITNIIEKAHKVKLHPKSVALDSSSDIFVMDYFADRTFHDSVAIADINPRELSFFRSVYRHSKSQEKINIAYKPKYFLEYYERMIEVYANFYEDVEIVWITSGEIESDITTFFSKIITPKYTIKDNILKIIGVKPRFEKFKDIPSFIKINEVNFNGISGDNFLDIFFERFNEHVIPKDVDIELTKEMDLKTLKDRLTLISMIMI